MFICKTLMINLRKNQREIHLFLINVIKFLEFLHVFAQRCIFIQTYKYVINFDQMCSKLRYVLLVGQN